MSIMKELDTLSQEIKEAESEVERAEGRRETMIDTLKQEFGIAPDAVEGTLDKIQKQMDDGMVKIVGLYEKLKEEYEW